MERWVVVVVAAGRPTAVVQSSLVGMGSRYSVEGIVVTVGSEEVAAAEEHIVLEARVSAD
jgi:hypothetical protein